MFAYKREKFEWDTRIAFSVKEALHSVAFLSRPLHFVGEGRLGNTALIVCYSSKSSFIQNRDISIKMENFNSPKDLSNYSNYCVENCSFSVSAIESFENVGGGKSQISNAKELPLDMQFNDGNLLSIIGYSVLLLVSAVGNISVGIQLIGYVPIQ